MSVEDSKMEEWLIESLKKLSKTDKKKLEVSEEGLELFMKISAVLSSHMPNVTDTSLCELYDILYPNEDIFSANLSSNYSKTTNMDFINICFRSFYAIYKSVFLRVKCRLLDTVFLQFLEHLTDVTIPGSNLGIVIILCELIYCRGGLNMCRGIIFLKTALDKHREFVEGHLGFCHITFCSFLWLAKVKEIPDAKKLENIKIISWLKRQCTIILDKYDLQPCEDEKKNLKNLKLLQEIQFDDNYVNLAKELPNFLAIHHLFLYFSSAQNEEEEIHRAKNFLIGHYKGFEKYFKTDFLRDLVLTIADVDRYLYDLTMKCDYRDDVMKIVDCHHCNDLEPHIIANNIDESIDDHDVTFEKYLLYDEFLKCLYVMSKIHNACMNCKQFLNQTKADIEGFDGELFRNTHSKMKWFLNKRLFHPSERGELPWWFNTVLKKCPFLIISKRNEYLLEDLIRMLKGGEIDNVTWEKLHFVINSTPGYCFHNTSFSWI